MLKNLFRRPSAPLGAVPLFQTEHLIRDRRAANESHIRHLCQSTYVGDGTVLARVLGRYKMYLDAKDIGLSGHLMLDGYWEMWLTEALVHAARPGMLAVDVGANLGYFTLLMCALAGEYGSVHSFEPNPAIAARLRRSMTLNGFDAMATLHEVALGAENEVSVTLIVPEGEPKNAHLHPALLDADANTRRVTMRRLDSYPELAALDLIKIDAEGAERMIWAGMEGVLALNRPMTVFMEFTPARYDDAAAFLAEITRWGFSLFRLDLSDGLVACTPQDVLAQPPREDQMLRFQR